MSKLKIEEKENKFLTGITGFDSLFNSGIPKGSSVLIAGGTGSGKTTLCMQMLAYQASQGKKCFYMSFEESEEKLKENLKDFGWNLQELIESGNLKIKRFLTSEIFYYDKKSGEDIQAMITKDVDPLLMELEPLNIVEDDGFSPDFIVLDSLSAVSSTFRGKDQSYRFYIERLFRSFEKIGSTNFFITETKQNPDLFSPSGVEDFLADGIIALYNIKQKNTKETALEVVKMRGEKHLRKIVPMQITDKGIQVYPKKDINF